MKNDSFLRACRGERPERTPIWLMRQAGRYLPEYRAVRARVSFEQLCRTPELCAEVTLQPVDRLDVDAAILFSDILVVFDALGVDVRFEPAPVIATPVRTHADLARLRWADPRDACRYVLDAVRACKAALADRVPLIGFCGAPFTTLSYLVEGTTSREFEHVKKLMFSEPGLFGQLMERLTDLLVAYLRAQVEAGADALQVFDSWAGALAPDDYREHVLPHTARLCAEVRDFAPPGRKRAPLILFTRGNANLLALSADLPADVLGVDWTIELDRAIDLVGPERVVQGNLDPLALLGPPALVERKARAIVAAGKRARAHIFNLGHGISRHTDPAIARLLVDTVHAA
ncbi:MAG TPA: uroporphyrinogen decarboxylase [Nannocystis sp.]